MEQVYEIALKIALPVGIGAFVLAIIIYIITRPMAKARLEVRDLRIALEHNPSPAHISKASSMFPAANAYTGDHKIQELARQCGFEEGRRVQRIEMVLGICRTVLGVGVLLIALVVAGKIWPPGGRP